MECLVWNISALAWNLSPYLLVFLHRSILYLSCYDAIFLVLAYKKISPGRKDEEGTDKIPYLRVDIPCNEPCADAYCFLYAVLE